jgi:MoaA/NifB/PqqE/SkfB family radical SAM enzyme
MTRIAGLHIELTSRCTLFCPRCGRTDWLGSDQKDSFRLVDLSYNNLCTFLEGANLTGCNVRFNGNYGDPIYNNKLLDFYSFFKHRGANVRLFTNGSYKPATFWKRLASLTTVSDRIIFSVDGTPDNFTNYRINADWESIEIAMRIMAKSKATVEWKLIPFSFNEESINEAKLIAANLGIDEFNVMPSNRWLAGNDPLRPTQSIISFDRPGTTKTFDPECKKYSTLFISADGYFYPCCYSADFRLVKDTMFDGNEEFNIANTTLLQHLANGSKMSEFFRNLNDNRLPACNFCCTK